MNPLLESEGRDAAGGWGGEAAVVRRGARLERTDASTLVRLSAGDPRSTWCPAAGPGPGKAGRRL